MLKKAYLRLENGKVFEGASFGAERTAIGELVFTTGMASYLETLSDPCYFGHIVCQTFPLIGNYGVIPSDLQSDKPMLLGYIVREWCQLPSNFRCEGELDTFLLSHDIPGICGIDTRELTRILREHGTMNAMITTDAALAGGTDALCVPLANAVAATSRSEVSIDGVGRRVVQLDLGAPRDMAAQFIARGCEVISLPHNTPAEDILEYTPCGIVLSDGPGDPAGNGDIVKVISGLVAAGLPIFAVGLGHQLLAMSQGAKTVKLAHGHRGDNQPVLDTVSGKAYTTSQNHGYAVDGTTLPDSAVERFRNINDGTNEGIEYDNIKALSVQFAPDTSNCPQNTAWLYDRFISMTEVNV